LRNQFDAEKKVAVSDTSIQNLQRSQQQLNEEQHHRVGQMEDIRTQLAGKETDLENNKASLAALHFNTKMLKPIFLKHRNN